MRIEVRNGEEWLVDAPADVNDCTAERNNHTCDTHFDGQHLATNRPREDGSALIVERWPIESAPAAEPARSATVAPRILTPAQAREASAPYVAKEIERINDWLSVGCRTFVVNAPLFRDIEQELKSAGWCVLNDGEKHGRVSFVVREREEGER